MTERQQRLLIANGAIVFLLGMAAGFPFAGAIADSMGQPSAFTVTGDVRGWRMAHLEGVLNGVLLIAVAAVANKLALGARGSAAVFWGLLATAWGNIIASILSPIFDARGLAPEGFWNAVNFWLFMAAIVGVVVAMAMVAVGALKQKA